MGKTDRFTSSCVYLNGSWYWRGIFPVTCQEIPPKNVSWRTPTPFFHPMTPVWDRSPADWGCAQSLKQHTFEFEEFRIAKLYIYIYIWIVNNLLSIRPPGGQPGFTRKPKVYSSIRPRHVFIFWHKCAQFLSVSQRIYHTVSAKLPKKLSCGIFSRGSFK